MSPVPLSHIKRLVRDVVLPFYQIRRHTTLSFDAGRPENDAEHSWSIALVACALAPHVDATLDIGQVCQFAMIHDLVEVYAGDTSNFAPASEKAGKADREHAAAQKLENTLRHFPNIPALIKDYESQISAEARFVKSIDKLTLLLFDYLEAGRFYQDNNITQEAWKTQMSAHREKARTHLEAFAYYEQLWDLLLDHPEFFYQDKS